MKALILILTASLFLWSCKSGPQIKEIKGFALPEGACSDGKYIFISNVGKEFRPLEKDGDGFISKIDKLGNIIELKYFPRKDTLHSPKGMAVLNDILYVTDIDKLKGYEIRTKEKIFEMDFSGEKTALLNDIVVKGNNTLLISCMDLGRIYEVRIKEKTFKKVADLPKPNGLYWEEKPKLLLVGQFGREDNANKSNGDFSAVKFTYDQVEVKEMASYQGNIDGIWKYKNSLIFTDWLAAGTKGKLKVMDISTKQVSSLLDEEFDGPADFYFDETTKTVWLPVMKENRVLIIDGLFDSE